MQQRSGRGTAELIDCLIPGPRLARSNWLGLTDWPKITYLCTPWVVLRPDLSGAKTGLAYGTGRFGGDPARCRFQVQVQHNGSKRGRKPDKA
jgi:hypothetical protein